MVRSRQCRSRQSQSSGPANGLDQEVRPGWASSVARLGIRTFKPTLRKAADRLATVHTPEGVPLPPNTLAELQRDMARLGVVISQIRQIEEARQKRLEQHHETGPHAMVRLLARIVGVGVETADSWFMRCCRGQCVTAEPWRATPA